MTIPCTAWTVPKIVLTSRQTLLAFVFGLPLGRMLINYVSRRLPICPTPRSRVVDGSEPHPEHSPARSYFQIIYLQDAVARVFTQVHSYGWQCYPTPAGPLRAKYAKRPTANRVSSDPKTTVLAASYLHF